jgi:hypothetical protein
LPLQGVLVANAEDDNMQMAANATTIDVRKRSADSSFDMLAAADFDQRLYSVTRKRRVTGRQNTIERIDFRHLANEFSMPLNTGYDKNGAPGILITVSNSQPSSCARIFWMATRLL